MVNSALIFVCMWVLGDVVGATYNEKFYWSFLMTFQYVLFSNEYKSLLSTLRKKEQA